MEGFGIGKSGDGFDLIEIEPIDGVDRSRISGHILGNKSAVSVTDDFGSSARYSSLACEV